MDPKDQEIESLKSQLESKDGEIESLKEQIESLEDSGGEMAEALSEIYAIAKRY